MLRTHGSRATKNPEEPSVFPKQQPAEIRVAKEFSELDLPPQCKLISESLFNHIVIITPDSGYWRNLNFEFSLTIPPTYPHDPPKVRCLTEVLHPNIDPTGGGVCLNILREEWRPVLSVYAVVVGLLHIFLEPEFENPLNDEAAKLMRQDPVTFAMFARPWKSSARWNDREG